MEVPKQKKGAAGSRAWFTMLVAIAWIAALVIAVWWYQPIAAFLGRRGPWDAVDFATLYSAGHAVANGHLSWLYQPEALWGAQEAALGKPLEQPLAYLNPPFFGVLLAPLARLPFDSAYQVWLVLNLGMAVLTGRLIWSTMSTLPPKYRWLVLAGLLTLYPLTFALRLGQFSPILMLSWAASYLALSRGRWTLAGVALSPLLVKPELLIPVTIYLLAKRHVEVFKSLLAITAIAVVASLAVTGLDGVIDYPRFILENAGDHTRGTRLDLMFGWNGLVGGFAGHEQPLKVTLLCLPLVAATAYACWMICRGPTSVANEGASNHWIALTLASILVDPNFFIQDTIILAPAFAACLTTVPANRRGAVLRYGAAAWVLLGLGLMPGAQWGLNIFSAYMAGCLGLLAWSSRSTALRRRTDGQLVGAAQGTAA